MNLADFHELDWRNAVERKAPPETIMALELRWRETRAGADSLLDCVPRWTPRWQRPDHLRPLAEAVRDAEEEAIRVLSSVPPQHGKTESLSHWLVRFILRYPHLTCAYVTYAQDKAEEKSRRMQDIAQSAGLEIRRDVRRLHEWRTPQGGGLLATGVGGPLTGSAVDGILLVDDPLKNREEAESPTIRAKILDWFRSTAMTRIHLKTSVIVNMTRWHTDDLIGTLQEDSAWRKINIPALDAESKALWPKDRPVEFLAEQRRTLGEYEWSSLYMGEPRPRGNFGFREPATYSYREMVDRIWGTTILIACDPAATAKTSADKSAIVVGAMKRGDDGLPVMHVLDVKTYQIEIPALVRELLALQKAWQSPIAVEAVAGFKSVPQMLKSIDRGLKVIEAKAAADKFVRAQPVMSAWNDQRVLVPRDAPWSEQFVRAVKRFSGVGDEHDDECLAGDTLIATARGSIPIRDVRADDMVATRRGWRRVLAQTMTNPSAETRTVELSNGNCFRATADHPVWTDNFGFLPVDSLARGYILNVWPDPKYASSMALDSAGIQTPNTKLTDGTFALGLPMQSRGSKHCTRKCGLPQMDRSPMAASSTIATAIPSTTRLTTSCAYLQPCIAGPMQQATPPRSNSSTWRALDPSPQSGTVVPRGKSGTASTVSSRGKAEFPQSDGARCAGRSSQRTAPRSPARVPTTAERSCAGSDSTQSGGVSSVARSSSDAGIPAPTYVVRVSTGRTEPVYNLHVEDAHEFYANGVLVHNCDALAHCWNELQKMITRRQSLERRAAALEQTGDAYG